MNSSPIPIRNIYYLFCYAWSHFREGRTIATAGTESPHVSDLLGTVLLGATKHLLRRGLDRGYVPHSEDSCCLRGRIDFAETIKRNLLLRTQAHCQFHELQYDILHNQILKTTLCNLVGAEPLDAKLRHELKRVILALKDVSVVRLNGLKFRTVQLGSNNAYYNFLMKVCELVHDALVPEGGGRRFQFRDILEDEVVMSRVFQNFVYNFYRIEQSTFRVSSERIYWDIEPGTDSSMLPSMMTDVSLRSNDRTVIVDTKYTPKVIQDFYGSETARSQHLYQIFAYVKNLERRVGPDKNAEGLLLYPTANLTADSCWTLGGHRIRVFTLNLAQHWTKIHRDLLDLVQVPNESSASEVA